MNCDRFDEMIISLRFHLGSSMLDFKEMSLQNMEKKVRGLLGMP